MEAAEMENISRSRVSLVLCAVGFAVAMTLRDELASRYMRVLLAAIAGGCIGMARFPITVRPVGR